MYLLLDMIFILILYWYIHSSNKATKQHTAKQPHFSLYLMVFFHIFYFENLRDIFPSVIEYHVKFTNKNKNGQLSEEAQLRPI
jgi:hypothetical protein